MNIHEYQARQLLLKYGVPVKHGQLCETLEDIERVKPSLEGNLFVIKAQVHTGGRGKAGGIKLAHSTEEAVKNAKAILGMTLITHQTGPQGIKVKKILIEKGVDILDEFYLSIIIDRESASPVIIASTEGGVDIEETARNNPQKIIIEPISIISGISSYQLRKIANLFSITEKNYLQQLSNTLKGMIDCFNKEDANIIEINPFAITNNGLLAIDTKITLDDNSIYRHEDNTNMMDLNESDPNEIEAITAGLSYIILDGNIGCMVNGAGLAMATMDIIKLHGGNPANFLDVGGNASTEKVTKAFKIILSDKKVKGILINIFGGIMKCDVIANGIIEAAKEINITVPLVVRLEGTNVEKGKEILKKSQINIISSNTMDEAAQKIVEVVKEN